jgi:RND family efflux transporter MFP subunit
MERSFRRVRVPAKACLRLAVLLLVLGASGPGCRAKSAASAGRPPVPVEAVTLAEHTVEETTEFVATVKSRRSTTVQPQVEGCITKIMVRSGDRVHPGTPLMVIDPSKQQAAVAKLESERSEREADLQLARQEAARMKTLLEAGAASRSEMEQAQTALSTTEARVKASDAQIREEQVALGYHTVVAPTAGVVGDIPVREGDSVTRSTALTSIDQNAGLETYISVPVQEAPRLRPGLSVHLVDEQGKVRSTEKISFIAPSVDPETQSVLAKAWIANPEGLRADQFVRARVVWAEAPALTVPFVSVNRINGQYFAFVAESGEGGSLVARQRAVDLGAVIGNDYVVRSGLKPGEKLIVSGVQKIGDGAQVTITAPAAQASPAPGGKGE